MYVYTEIQKYNLGQKNLSDEFSLSSTDAKYANADSLWRGKADLDLGKGCYRAGVEVNVYVCFDTCVDIGVEFT